MKCSHPREYLILIAFLLGCSGSHTRIHLALTNGVTVDNYQLRIGTHMALAAPLDELDLVVPDEMAGSEQLLAVWGLQAGQQVAYGMTTVTPKLHATVQASVALAGVSCGTFCMEGAVECLGDGTSTCTMQPDGCLAWATAVPCPSTMPFCSGGMCAAQCSDDCSTGQTECDGATAMRQCGQHDSDSCLDWSSAMACPGGQTCSGGSCGAPATCAHDGDGCDDGDACTIGDSCEGGTCSGMPKCTSAPANADPTCASGTCGFTCHTGYVPSGTTCVAASKLIFVTSSTYDGNLGGLAGADAKCQARAAGAGLTGTFEAWLSDTTHDARARLTHASNPYVLADGTTVAADWTELISGTLEHAPNRDETGTIVTGNTEVWTATNHDGTRHAGTISMSFCQDWTSSSDGLDAELGNSGSTASWSVDAFDGCQNDYHLYCLEQ